MKYFFITEKYFKFYLLYSYYDGGVMALEELYQSVKDGPETDVPGYNSPLRDMEEPYGPYGPGGILPEYILPVGKKNFGPRLRGWPKHLPYPGGWGKREIKPPKKRNTKLR
jgi:hypothetical protein